MLTMGGEAAIRARAVNETRAVNEIRAGQRSHRVVYVSLIFCKQWQDNVLVYILLGLLF